MQCLATLIRILDLAAEDRAQLLLENAALRHQLAVLKRSVSRPKIEYSDRMVWIMLRRMLKEWKEALIFVKPATAFAGIAGASSTIGGRSRGPTPAACRKDTQCSTSR
jgi:hypothetical protein